MRVTGPDGCARIRHKVYTGSGRISLPLVQARALALKFDSSDYKRAREGVGDPSLWVASVCVNGFEQMC